VFGGGEDGTSALHVARQRDGSWVWLDKPLISCKKPFTHVVEASIAFGPDGAPIVAWSEERNVTLARLFVSRWDGTSWRRLGELNPGGSDYYLSPTVAVDRGEIWLAWAEGQPAALRVTRWDGAKWSDVGRQELKAIVGDRCRLSTHGCSSMVVDVRGFFGVPPRVAAERCPLRAGTAPDGLRWRPRVLGRETPRRYGRQT
jgi:hypothetical protein